MDGQLECANLSKTISGMDQNASRAISESQNAIDASTPNVWKIKRKKKYRKRCITPISSLKSEQISTGKGASSKQSTSRESTSTPYMKQLSETKLGNLEQCANSPSIEKKLSEKYSSLLFSADSSFSLAETQIFNRSTKFHHSEASVAETFLSEYEARPHHTRISVSSRSNENCEVFSETLVSESDGKNSDPSMEVQSHSGGETDWEEFSQKILSRSFGDHSQEIPSIDHQSLVTINKAFKSPVNENMLSPSESDDCDDYPGTEEQSHFVMSVNERLRSQNMNQSLLTEQNNQISLQMRNFECFVREKIGAAENYIEKKFTELHESHAVLMSALNDAKSTKHDIGQPETSDVELMKAWNEMKSRQIGKFFGSAENIEPTKLTTTRFTMPKIPVSKLCNLATLNSALENVQYMEQFVSHVSHLVKSNAYNAKQSVKSLMSKLFSLNLLVKYCWTLEPTSTKPSFSTLTNVLYAIAQLLTNHVSAEQMRQELKEIFKEIPLIYEQQRKRSLERRS